MCNLIIAGAFVALAARGGIVSAQTTDATTEARNKATIERSFNAWRDGTGSPYDLLADNATWTIVGRSAASKTYESREAFMRVVIRPFNAGCPRPCDRRSETSTPMAIRSSSSSTRVELLETRSRTRTRTPGSSRCGRTR
jgi:ketosteroid isomerase-like protein